MATWQQWLVYLGVVLAVVWYVIRVHDRNPGAKPPFDRPWDGGDE